MNGILLLSLHTSSSLARLSTGRYIPTVTSIANKLREQLPNRMSSFSSSACPWCSHCCRLLIGPGDLRHGIALDHIMKQQSYGELKRGRRPRACISRSKLTMHRIYRQRLGLCARSHCRRTSGHCLPATSQLYTDRGTIRHVGGQTRLSECARPERT